MSPNLQQTASDALALELDERAHLAHLLITSLDTDSELDHSNLWDREIGRRAEDIRAGRAQGRPADEALREIRARFE